MVEAVKLNYPQREIADASFALQQGDRRRAIGSSSASTATSNGDEQPIPTPACGPALERKQIDRLQARPRPPRPRSRRAGPSAPCREDAAHEDRT